jgi:hypothetical protein
VLQADQDRSSPHDLASRTVAHLKAKGSVEEGAASSTSRFDLDEVSGPLKSAHGTDGVVDIDDTYEEEIKEQEGAWTHKVKREHAERVKVWRLAFRFVVPFKPNIRYSSLDLLEGSLLASEPSPQKGGSSRSPSFPSVLLVIGSCDPQVSCKHTVRAHSPRPQPSHNTFHTRCHRGNVRGRVLRPLYFSI